jgi:exodeoxyribonuclease-3
VRIASFNINGIKARLPRLVEWLEETRPAVACLQEIKTQDEGFPRRRVREDRLPAIWHGQKGFNGVAILADGIAPVEAGRGLPGDPEDEQARYIEADVNGSGWSISTCPTAIRIRGPSSTTRSRGWSAAHPPRRAARARDPAVVVGDFNVIPEDKDVWSVQAMAADALMQPASRDAYRRILNDGWTDALDTLNPRGGYGPSGTTRPAPGSATTDFASITCCSRPNAPTAGRCGRRQGYADARRRAITPRCGSSWPDPPRTSSGRISHRRKRANRSSPSGPCCAPSPGEQ